LALAAASAVAAPSPAYDSGGFEAPRFVAGSPLEGQDPQGPWLKSGTGATATVQTATVFTGSQAVRVDRTSGDTRWSVLRAAPVANQAIIDWDMNVTQSTHAGDFGPFFGVEAYDALDNPPLLAGSAGVDAKTGDVLYQAATTGIFTETGTKATFGQWNHFRLLLDYSTDRYSVFFNGTAVASNIGFVDPGVDDFTDAPISALAAAVEPPIETGTAYFDNYTLIPEPASLGLMGAVAVVGLLGRRSQARRRRTDEAACNA